MFPKGTFIFYTIRGPAFLPLSYYGPGAIAASKGVNSAHQIATSKTIFSGTGGRDMRSKMTTYYARVDAGFLTVKTFCFRICIGQPQDVNQPHPVMDYWKFC